MNILDNTGYATLVEHWGSDERVIESARMSTQASFKGWGNEDKPGDEKLLKYLYDNFHCTPFEMAGATFELRAPIFVARQIFRHRTASFNEESARYSEIEDKFYFPSIERLKHGGQAKKNKQSSGVELSDTAVDNALTVIVNASKNSYVYYETLIACGLARELARAVLPQNIYTRFRMQMTLRNWLHFLGLRMDEHTQWETRQYANAIHDELTKLFPRTLKLFDAKT